MLRAIITFNAGPSSIEFSLYEVDGSPRLRLTCRGEVDGIGAAPRFVARDPGGGVLAEQKWPDPNEAFAPLLQAVLPVDVESKRKAP